MAFTVAEAIADARLRHPAFTERAVPRPVLLPWLTSFQRRLYGRAIEQDRDYLVQQMSVFFPTNGGNGPGVAGADNGGGLPAIDDEGTVTYGDTPAGSLADLDVAGAREVLGANAATSGTTLSTTLTGAGRVVNGDANYYYVVVAGTGYGTRRKIASNTADTWTWDDPVDVAADETTVFRIVDADTEVNEAQGVVTSVPALGTRVGYLVKINAGGQPYLDLSTPLTAQYDAGIPLPPVLRVLGATVRRDSTPRTELCNLTFYGQRTGTRFRYSAYEQNGSLFLVGTAKDWEGVSSLDLRYHPLPPAIAAAADVVFLSDQANDAVVSGLSFFMAQRLYKRGIEGDELEMLKGEAVEAEAQFLASLARPGQARKVYTTDRFDP